MDMGWVGCCLWGGVQAVRWCAGIRVGRVMRCVMQCSGSSGWSFSTFLCFHFELVLRRLLILMAESLHFCLRPSSACLLLTG